MGNPCKAIPAIQVAGTNGKGSIANFLQTTLKFADIRTGVTTSPHLISWRERICTNGEQISSEEFRRHLRELSATAKKYLLTPFELLIAIAFTHFAEKDIELLVLEVGLGGRKDATTAHPYRPIIAMASIGLDHCEYLGRNLQDIAQEKAAVISEDCTIISAEQHPLVSEILIKTAEKKNAKLKWVEPLSNNWTIGLNGQVQKKNAAVAKGTIEELVMLGWNIEEEIIRKGLAHASWPGRLQTITWNKQPLIVDGAHNLPAAEELSKEREKWLHNENGVNWILGIQKQKDAPNMLRSLLLPKDLVWIVPIKHYQSWTKFELSSACPELSEQILQANEISEIFAKMASGNNWPSPPPVVAGSLYLVGELLSQQIIKSK